MFVHISSASQYSAAGVFVDATGGSERVVKPSRVKSEASNAVLLPFIARSELKRVKSQKLFAPSLLCSYFSTNPMQPLPWGPWLPPYEIWSQFENSFLSLLKSAIFGLSTLVVLADSIKLVIIAFLLIDINAQSVSNLKNSNSKMIQFDTISVTVIREFYEHIFHPTKHFRARTRL